MSAGLLLETKAFVIDDTKRRNILALRDFIGGTGHLDLTTSVAPAGTYTVPEATNNVTIIHTTESITVAFKIGATLHTVPVDSILVLSTPITECVITNPSAIAADIFIVQA